MTKGLALSGGGARGSFQMGALDCLYTVFGYRPDVIAGTSVGSINGLVLAQAKTDADKLAQMLKLRSIWRSLNGCGDFYQVQQWLEDLTRSKCLDFGQGLSVRIEDVVAQLAFNNLGWNAKRSTSLAKLDPLEKKMRDPSLLDTKKLAGGLPLRMACVSLESGRLRYATGDGRFLEDDNTTPVASALPMNAIPGLSNAQLEFSQAVATVRSIVEAIDYEEDHGADQEKIAQLEFDLDRARWHAEAALDRLAEVNKQLRTPLHAAIDPIRGALASAAMPGIFGPYELGAEHYVDGGVREVVPVRAAIHLGATEVIAIVASTQNLPRAGYKGSQNFAAIMLSSLTDITLKEVVADDLSGRGVGDVKVTSIIPGFNVHDTAVVNPGLIDINMAYGYMRAADVVSALSEDARHAAMQLSDAVARIRTETHLLHLATNPLKPGTHEALEQFRFRKWLIRKLVEARIASKVALPQLAMLWFQTWETGASTEFVSNPWSAWSTAATVWSASRTTPAVAPYSYVPDGWVFDQESDLNGLYIVRAGAVFRGTASTVGAVGASTPAFTVPVGTTANLPKVPVAGTVVAEVASGGGPVTTAGEWFVDGTRRYLLNIAAKVAMGLPAATPVPVGGLTQIPDGGSPYMFGGLAVSDSQPALIHVWDPTPPLEGTTYQPTLFLWNRSDTFPRPATPHKVHVKTVTITTPAEVSARAVFTVKTPGAGIDLDPGQVVEVTVEFEALAPGPVTGLVQVECDDPIAPSLRIPLSTSVVPLGTHGELSVTPTSIDFGTSAVGKTVGQYVTVTNTGGRTAFNGYAVVSDPPGQFAIPEYSLPGVLDPGKSGQVYVSYTPTKRGAAQAVLAIDMESDTDVSGVQYKQRYEVPLTGLARMPTIFIAALPLPPIVRPPRPPIDPPPLPRLEAELLSLDFGAAAPGTLSVASFWLRNVGDAPLTVQGVTTHNNFGINNPTIFPATLSPGGELEVPANFLASSVAGELSAGWFDIHSDDPLRPKAALPLQGRAAGPHLLEAKEVLDLGVVPSGSTATITYRSDGTAPVTVEKMSLSGKDFSVTSSPSLPTQLLPGSELTVTVKVATTGHGPITDTLVVTHDATPNHRSNVTLRAFVQ
jgi:predicted acylesterase/phospholipase RssA